MELPGSVALGDYPQLFATVNITNTGKSIQEYGAYKVC